MSQFLTPLLGEWLDDDVRFELHEPLIYQSDVAGMTFNIPAGFVTDFASVPRVPIIYELFGDKAHHESVVHDFIYQTHATIRGTADKVFKEAMILRGKPGYVVWGMYWGVVLGGWNSYRTGPSRYLVLNGGPAQTKEASK